MLPTPTPIFDGTPDATPIAINIEGMHVYMVQGYNVVNSGGYMDYIFVLVITLIVVFSIWWIVKALKDV